MIDNKAILKDCKKTHTKLVMAQVYYCTAYDMQLNSGMFGNVWYYS